MNGSILGALIDVYHHILPEAYVNEIGADYIGSQGSTGRIPAWSVTGALELMDAAGIATAITSISSPGVNSLPYRKSLEVTRQTNLFAASLVEKHPKRFGMFTLLPLRGDDNVEESVASSIEETIFSCDRLGADGVCLLSNYSGRYLGDPVFRPLLEFLEEREAVVFVHPTLSKTRVDVSGMSPSMLEFPFDTTRTIASLLVEGAIAATPGVRWIFSHAGGALPYLVGRLEVLLNNNRRLGDQMAGDLMQLAGGLYFDTALSVDKPHMSALLSVVKPDHILFGSDYPFGPPGQMTDTVDRLRRLNGIEELRASITRNTLFPRFA